jgi:hypothetical protein
VAVALVNAAHPQPPWQDAEVFASNYHAVQLLPYVGGIVLVAALVALISSIHAVAREGQKALRGVGSPLREKTLAYRARLLSVGPVDDLVGGY